MKKIILNHNNQVIKSIDQWKTDCPPMKKAHWVEGRSAYETAKLWINEVPDSFLTLFGNDISSINVYPEYKTKLDDYQGNQRNHDLFVEAQNSNKEQIIICLESKVDEPFGPTIKSNVIGNFVSPNFSK